MNSLKKAFCSLGWAGTAGQYVSWEREGVARTRRRREEKMERCISFCGAIRVAGGACELLKVDVKDVDAWSWGLFSLSDGRTESASVKLVGIRQRRISSF